MSNLKLPKMHPVTLRDIVRPGDTKTVAYATTVENRGGVFYVRHHGNPIAIIGTFGVSISNAGWGSSTTRTRLTTILHDNDIKAHVTQIKGVQYLRVLADQSSREWSWEGAELHPFSRAIFEMRAGTWALAAVSDSQYGGFEVKADAFEVAA
jgi:hypothetical protein